MYDLVVFWCFQEPFLLFDIKGGKHSFRKNKCNL